MIKEADSSVKNKKTLTASQINYLIALYYLDTGNSGIRCVDIAKTLEISKPSVYTMMKTLSDIQFVNKTKYGTFFLTDEGRNAATQYSSYNETIYRYFEESFELSSQFAKRAALAVIPELLLGDIQNVCALMNNKMGEGMENVPQH